MPIPRRCAFTLVELLIVVAVLALLAAILFPVLSQTRERARMGACLSNMRQIGSALVLYAQDYDETYPYIRFHAPGAAGGMAAARGNYTYVWKNALGSYLRSSAVFGCPSNPLRAARPGVPGVDPPEPGMNAEGWEVEPGQQMPISYTMNACASTWYPADDPRAGPPLRTAQVARPADTILVAENRSVAAGIMASHMWARCGAVFAHSSGRDANFVFFDGHARSKRWLATLYPLAANNWQADLPNPDPANRSLNGAAGCQWTVPAGPEAQEYQTPDCQSYQ